MPTVYYLNCRDVGVECDFEACGETVEGVIEQCADHGRREHGMKGFTPDLFARMRRLIRKVEAEPPPDG